MKQLFVFLALTTGCMRQTHPRFVEAPDPEVGDMSCAPPMSIHALLDHLHDVGPSTDCQASDTSGRT